MVSLDLVLKDLDSKALVCESALEGKSNVICYFLGKEQMLLAFKFALQNLNLCTEEDLKKAIDEAYLKGFEKGKEIILNNLKVFLNGEQK